jgi:hypothetical protein
MDASSVDAVIALANAHLGAEKYNDAIRTLRGAIDGSPDNVDDRLRQALQRAEAALKQSKQVNYYKVLDVPRTADSKAIKSAYRKVRRPLTLQSACSRIPSSHVWRSHPRHSSLRSSITRTNCPWTLRTSKRNNRRQNSRRSRRHTRSFRIRSCERSTTGART